MRYEISDAIVMIGELHYQKRMLEEELKTLKAQVVESLSRLESAETRMAELEATLNGHKEEVSENA